MHGPRVDEGTSAMLNMGVGRNIPTHRDENFLEDGPQLVPSLWAGGRIGNTRALGSTAFSVGLGVPAAAVLWIGEEESLSRLSQVSYADVYVQPHRPAVAGTDYGVGIMASTVLFNPYIQYGRTKANGSSWYTTQSVIVTSGDEDESLAMYSPSVSWRTLSKSTKSATSFNVGAAVGRLGSRTEWFLLVSFTAEMGLKSSR
jgi:hypothetical protein